MTKRLSINHIQQNFAKVGLILHSTVYKNNHTPLEVTCKNGHRRSITWNSFLNKGTVCSGCSGKAEHTIVEATILFAEHHYQMIDEKYTGSRNKLRCICPEGHTTAISYDNFNRGKRCGECFIHASKSRGELEVARILDKLNLRFEIEKVFPDCRHIRPLSFDFFVDGKLIEFHGLQHYEMLNMFGSSNPQKAFDAARKRDRIKVRYAKKKRIPLLIIPYTEIDVMEPLIRQFLQMMP